MKILVEFNRLATPKYKASVIAKHDDLRWQQAVISPSRFKRSDLEKDMTADREIAHVNGVVANEWANSLWSMADFWEEEEMLWYLAPMVDRWLLTNLTDVYAQGA